MKKSLIQLAFIGLVWGLSGLSAHGQQTAPPRPHHHQMSEEEIAKFEAAKVALITTKLNLSPSQAKEFWPIYNEFNSKRKQFRREIKQLLQKAEQMDLTKADDEAAQQLLKRFSQVRQAEVAIESDYTEKFLKIVKPSQLVQLFNAEREAMRTLMRHAHKPADKE